jgi:ubiquinone/menaquinone biosynthesis C-methylase UbiE
MNIANAYSEWAATYDSDRNRTRDLDAEVTRRLWGLQPVPVIVEAGCGTGKNTEHFSQIAERVHALDFSSGMLEVARRRVPSPHVSFQQADLTSDWPCPARCANLVSFNLVLEHVEDIEGVVRKAADALLPGGSVFISELHPFKQYQGTQASFSDAEGKEVRIPAFTHHVSDYLSAAQACGLQLVQFNEWWHHEDPRSGVPRLIAFIFRSATGGEPAALAGSSGRVPARG